MSRMTDYILDAEERGELEYNVITGNYEPTKGVARGKQESTLESTLGLTREHIAFIKSDAFKQEWIEVCKKVDNHD